MSIGLFSLSLIFIFSAFVDCKYILSSNVPDRYDRHEVIFWIRRTEINLLKADAEAFSRNDNDCLKELILFRDGRKSQKETAMSSALALNKILAEYKVESSLVTISGDFVWAKANISTWENIFSTRFSMLIDGSGIYPSVYRAATYKLDDNIAPSVQAVFNVLENPVYVTENREVYSTVKYFMRNFITLFIWNVPGSLRILFLYCATCCTTLNTSFYRTKRCPGSLQNVPPWAGK